MHRFSIIIVIIILQFIVFKYSIADYSGSLKAYNNNNWKLSISECDKLINNSKCLNILGVIYLNGYGVSKDLDKASILFLLSESLGNKSAKFNLGWMALMGLGEEVNINKASDYFKSSLTETNKYNTPNLDEELLEQSNKKLIKLSDNNFIAKFNSFYAEYLKLINLVSSKLNIEKQYITDITAVEEKLRFFEDKFINLNVNIIDLKDKVKKDQELLIKLLILSLNNNYIEFEKVIKQSYINLIEISI
ncbi:hypothetical protein OAC06_05290 [Alphaproteobacteria bacterium]|nr:hypothetical protein [Alphaproteobacteria bacterium]